MRCQHHGGAHDPVLLHGRRLASTGATTSAAKQAHCWPAGIGSPVTPYSEGPGKERMDTNFSTLNEHKHRVARVYNLAAADYDKPALHFFHRIAQRLVELAQPKPGDMVLDVATGTGAAALC